MKNYSLKNVLQPLISQAGNNITFPGNLFLDITIVDTFQNNYLHYLIKYHLNFDHQLYKIRFVKLLLEKEIDTNVQNNCGSTPLHLAIEKEARNVACLIAIHTPTNVNIQNKNGQTALHLAVRMWKISSDGLKSVSELVEILIQRGADLNIKGKCVIIIVL